MNTDEKGEVGIIPIAQLLGLFLAFLGEATTLHLIDDLFAGSGKSLDGSVPSKALLQKQRISDEGRHRPGERTFKFFRH
jgi:hypothetical protein